MDELKQELICRLRKLALEGVTPSTMLRTLERALPDHIPVGATLVRILQGAKPVPTDGHGPSAEQEQHPGGRPATVLIFCLGFDPTYKP